MGRGSDKHAPLMDDAIKKETESIERGSPVSSRAEEYREQEDDAEDALTETDGDSIELRSLIARSLPRVAFPATRDELIQEARESNAPESVLGTLRRLPSDKTFADANEIWVAAGGNPEERS